jgi:NtrC-family two-component system sensor histidine kinase KinB
MSQDPPTASLDLLFTISRELVSSLDLQVVLSRVLSLSTNYVGAERGSLIALDEAQRPFAAAQVINKQLVPATPQQLQAILDHGLAGWVVRNCKKALVGDTSQDDRWYHRLDDSIDQTGPKAAICIPILMAGEQLVGVLTIVHPVPGYFNKEHLSLIQSIADIAGIAIYNAHLHEELQYSRRRYQELFEASIDPILITDWEGRIHEVNRQVYRLTGFDPVELNKLTIFQLHEVDLDWLKDHSQELRKNQTLDYESVLLTHSGDRIPIEAFVHSVNIEEGMFLQWLFRDISERKTLEILREDLFATIYHDLRSPLSNVVSCLDMIGSLNLTETNPSIKQILEIANRSIDRLQRLISSLLDINRIELGKPLASKEVADPATLVSEVVETAWTTAAGKKQTIKLDLPEQLPLVEIDIDMIKRVLFNLIENAMKFTPNGGLIKIGANAVENWVQFWVTDTGPGIPEEAKEKIFDKFTRIKVQGAPKGIGLGLAFCRLAVMAHGGKIWVDNEGGKGSRFIFTLPVKKVKNGKN